MKKVESVLRGSSLKTKTVSTVCIIALLYGAAVQTMPNILTKEGCCPCNK